MDPIALAYLVVGLILVLIILIFIWTLIVYGIRDRNLFNETKKYFIDKKAVSKANAIIIKDELLKKYIESNQIYRRIIIKENNKYWYDENVEKKRYKLSCLMIIFIVLFLYLASGLVAVFISSLFSE